MWKSGDFRHHVYETLGELEEKLSRFFLEHTSDVKEFSTKTSMTEATYKRPTESTSLCNLVRTE